MVIRRIDDSDTSSRFSTHASSPFWFARFVEKSLERCVLFRCCCSIADKSLMLERRARSRIDDPLRESERNYECRKTEII